MAGAAREARGATESANAANTGRNAAQAGHPAQFAFSDDALFERGSAAIESAVPPGLGIKLDAVKPSPLTMGHPGRNIMFATAAAIAIATAMATMYDMISKYFGYVSAIVMNPRDQRLATLADTIPHMVPYMSRLVIIACLLVVAPLGRAEDTSITCGNNLEYACSGGAEYARLGSADGQVRTDIQD